MFLELLHQHRHKLVDDESVGKLILEKVMSESVGFFLTEQIDNFRFFVFNLEYLPKIYTAGAVVYLFIDNSKISALEYSSSFIPHMREIYQYEYDNSIEDIVSHLSEDFEKVKIYLQNGNNHFSDGRYYFNEDAFYNLFQLKSREINMPTISSFFPTQTKSARNQVIFPTG